MNVDDELEVEDRLRAQLRQLDAVEVPDYRALRERAQRRRSGMTPFVISVSAVLALLTAAIVDSRLGGLADVPGALAPAQSTQACGSAQDQGANGTCRLIAARVVEVIGAQVVRVTPDSLKISAEFENPALFAADARTRIEPAASTIAATGVTPGAQVEVAFDAREPKTASGARLLTRFVVLRAGGAPDCANGSPVVENRKFPQGVTHGAATAEAAFREENPNVGEFAMFPFSATLANGPVWIVAGTDTFVATILPDGSWFLSPAKFIRCRSLEEIQSTSARRTPDPNATPLPTPQGSPPAGPFTPAQVSAGMPASAAILAQTDPTCVRGANANVFRCTLSRPPAPEQTSFLGTAEWLAIQAWIVGGCVSLNRDGMSWDCYIGQEAVDRGIIGPALLGQFAPAPGRG